MTHSRLRPHSAAFALAMVSTGSAYAAPAPEAVPAVPATPTASVPVAAPQTSLSAAVPPALVKRVEPTYPLAALPLRLSATVVVEAVIDERGAVLQARVLEEKGHGFDEAALDAMNRSEFAPGRSGGVPISSVVDLSFDFQPPAAPVTLAPAPAIETLPKATGPALQTGRNQSTVVTAKRVRPASILEPESIAASDSETSQDQLSLRPRLRTENLLEAVPGLFTVQHAGGGKAQQYFMRGFDLDHGTDLAFFVDGAPINEVSHAHGQGYSDLHFIIPEVVETLESTKGPYSARVGDFATAGSVTFHMADHIPENIGRLEVGPDGHKRAVAAMSPDLGDDWRAAAAVEVFNENGPFIHPEDYDRFSGYLKVTRVLDEKSQLSMMLTAYGGTWNMSGVLPARAVCGEGDGTKTVAAYMGSHCISRWDSIDPSQGGETERVETVVNYRRQIDHDDIEATAWALHQNMQLFPNDGIAASFQPMGMQYGSQVEQDDTRSQIGANLRMSRTYNVLGFDFRTTAGLQVRDDMIEVQLHRTEQRQRLDGMPGIPGPIVDDTTNETELGAYAEADWRATKWLRFVLAGREDRVDAALNNESDLAVVQASGYKGASQFSPKATIVVSPVDELELFANYGRGFHTNDARSVLVGTQIGPGGVPVTPTLMAAATGYEVGTTVRPLSGLTVTAVAFLLDITQELTVDGDTDATSPSGPTRRYGGEFVGRYQLGHGFFADSTLTLAHARYTDAADIQARQAYVTLAPARTFSAGVGAREPIGPFTVVASAYMRSMAQRPATQDYSLTATGYNLFNAQAGLRWKMLEFGADLLNIGNTKWREGQFAVSSRLPGEGPNPAQGISFTPGVPREAIFHGILYW